MKVDLPNYPIKPCPICEHPATVVDGVVFCTRSNPCVQTIKWGTDLKAVSVWNKRFNEINPSIERFPITITLENRDEESLLLFLETRAVDYGGVVQTLHMNKQDMEIAGEWNKKGFVEFGRIAFKDITKSGTHWCKLTPKSWEIAHQLRKERAERLWRKRNWKTTKEI